MDMIKAYAQQVASYLPAKGREELANEIHANLSEEFDDWFSEHPDGSPAEYLDETKVHPMKYATSLADGSSTWLIGPQLYFSFISALKVGVSITVAVYFFLGLVVALTTGSYVRNFMGVFADLPDALLWVSAAILGVFVAIEKSGDDATWLDNWSSKDLKPLDGRLPISRTETFFDLGLSTLLLLLILDIVHLPATIRHDGVWVSGWTVLVPEWVWWAAGTLLVFDILFSVFRLFRSHWTARLRLTTIATNVIWIGLLLFVSSQPELLQIAEPTTDKLDEIMPFVNRAARGVILVIAATLAWDTLMHTWRLVKRR